VRCASPLIEPHRHGDAKIFTIFEGTSEIQRMLIGRAVTGLDVR
jgi:acyl-CoA dehydrogenase